MQNNVDKTATQTASVIDLPEGVPPLSQIYLYITGSCNLNCRHCWIEPTFGAKIKKYLPWTTLRPIFEEGRTLGLTSVKITGGEPFLHPEMNDMLYALHEMGLALRMETNGTLIGPNEAKALKDTGTWFSISIDGATAELHDDLRGVQGSFKRTLKGIECVRNEGLNFQIITCLHRNNRDFLPDMITLAWELGAGSLKVNPITDDGRGAQMDAQGELLSVAEVLDVRKALLEQVDFGDDFKVFFDVPPAFKSLPEIRENSLGTCGILNILGILHDGTAGLCGIGEHVADMNFGSLLEPGALRRVWVENAVLGSIRENLPENLGGICGQCMFKHYCLGKCVAHTYTSEGSLFEGFPFCQQAYEQGLFPETRIVPGT